MNYWKQEDEKTLLCDVWPYTLKMVETHVGYELSVWIGDKLIGKQLPSPYVYDIPFAQMKAKDLLRDILKTQLDDLEQVDENGEIQN